ncbi:MAG: HAD-IA family hydrolase [bacterium]|nr:HAD-IA family hydrolase [bacterium]
MIHTPIIHPGPGAGRRIRGLIFDMDGTILDTRPFHMAAWRQLVARLGLDGRAMELAESGFGKTNWAIFHEWWGKGAAERDLDALSEEKERLFRQLIQGRGRVRPGFIALLEQARRWRLRIALATSGPAENAAFLLADLGIARWFDAVAPGSAAIRSKPHPDPFLIAAGRQGVPPQQCVAFEDSSHGFWSVRRAGMPLVAIAERKADLLSIQKWTPYVYEDFRPVPALLAQWVG